VAESPQLEDWELLGLHPGADRAEVVAAYRSRREAYRSGSLAAFGLLAEEECAALLERVEAAFQRLVASLPGGDGPGALTDDRSEAAPTPPPEPRLAPGAYLHFHRERQGMSVETASAQTRIRASLIRALEEQALAALPEPVYVRGFVVALARILHLPEPDHLAQHYLRLLQAPTEKR
jgi:hypothetical protein